MQRAGTGRGRHLAARRCCGTLTCIAAVTVSAAVIVPRVLPGVAAGYRLGQPLHVVLRDLTKEPGGHTGCCFAVQRALAGVGQRQLLFGAGHGHIAQPALLLHLVAIAHGAISGKKPLLHAHHKYLGEFQALGGVHGHHGHAVVAVHPAVQVGVQRDLIQEAGETRLRALGVFQVGQDAGAQLLHVLQPAAALHIVLLPQGGCVAASLADVIVELRQLTLRQAAAHFLDHICKGFQLASCIFQLGEFLRTAEYVVERQAVLCGNNLGLVHGGLADLAGGNVDDAPQAQIVRGVVDDAQIGKHILDLGPVKELQTTVDLIGDAAALAGVFQRVGLGVGTVQHRTVTPAAAPAVVHHDLPQDKVGLVALVEGGLYRHQLTAAVLRPQGLALAALVVADDCVCRV